jgi:parallel beta-helix repeat protein
MKKIIIYLIYVLSLNSFAVNYYVSTSGNDDNDGLTIETTFQTIQRASYAVSPGDTVFIRNGIYSYSYPESLIVFLTISGTEGNPITFRNYPGENPILQMNGTNWGAIKLNGCDYIIIDGLTIIGNNDNITLEYAQSQQTIIGNPETAGNGIAIDAQYENEVNKAHHVIVRNCTVSKCGGGGIYTYNADYTTIENNTVFECAWYTPYGNSGISMYQNWNSDTSIGIKNYITGNTCYRNENFIPWYVTNSILDGNGIIIDDNRNTQNNSTLGIYTGKTYVANNLVFDNGGRGIHCYESDNVIIVNNTCYKNCQSPAVQSGEFTAYDASNITYINNIVSPDIGIPPMDKDDSTTSNIVAFNNLFTTNATLSNPIGINTIIGNAAFILPNTDPTIANFHLQSTSLAINGGIITNAPLTDKDGIVRLENGTIDIGCYEFQNSLTTNSLTKSNTMFVYPNPANENFTIQLPDNISESPTIVEIIDLIGRKVHSQIIKSISERINTIHLNKGTYLIKVENENKKYSGKLIID